MMTSASTPSRSSSADVAIIMRTKDRLLLLPRALGSVLLQKFSHWHLYLVNDGGDQDALEKLLNVYRPVFGDRLTVIRHEKSLGMQAASNAALAAGTEEFVIVHDDDDSWDVDFLLNTVLFMSSPDNARYLGVATDCFVINEAIEDDGSVRELDRHIRGREDGATDYAHMLFRNAFAPICFLFRRSIIAEIGLFDAELPVLGDWDFNIRLMKKGDIGHICKPLANYHHRRMAGASTYANSIMSGTHSHKLQNILLRNRLLRGFFEKQPESLGFLMALLQPLRETDEKTGRTEHALNELRHHVHYLERQIDRLIGMNDRLLSQMDLSLSELDQVRTVASWQRKMLRPAHALWRRALPVRRLISRLRGRT